ncbi:MAG: hypothetical protein ACR2NM_13845, partial [Bythopirellula sp.]
MRLLATSAAIFALAIHATSTWATVFNWTDTFGGNFSSASNWSPAGGPPNDNADTAVFDLLAAYEVDFTSDVINRNLEVTTGTVTLDMTAGGGGTNSGFDYILATQNGAAAHIGSSPGSPLAAKLVVGVPEIGNPRVVSLFGFLHIGRDANSKGILQLGLAEWQSDNTTFVGVSGEGTLTINFGGYMLNKTGIVGLTAGSSGTVQVDNLGQWENTGDLFLGISGDAVVTIDGELSNEGNGTIAAQTGSFGNVIINNTWMNSGDLYVGGGAAAAGGSGRLTIDDTASGPDANVTVGGDMIVHSTGRLTLRDGLLNVAGQLEYKRPVPLTIDNFDRLIANDLTIDPTTSLNFAGDITQTGPGLALGQLHSAPGAVNWSSGKLEINASDLSIDDTQPLGNNVTFDGLKRLDIPNGSLQIAQTSVATVVMNGGTKITSNSGRIGNESANHGPATLQMTGSGTNWNVSGTLGIGGRDGANVTISTGADLVTTTAVVAADPLASADIELSSAGTTWNSSGSVYLGSTSAATSGGAGKTRVLSNAGISVGNTLRVGENYELEVTGIVSAATLDLHGTTTYVNQILDVAAGGDVGEVRLANGTLTVETIDLGSGGQFNVTGGTLHVDVFQGDLTNESGILAPGRS